MNQQFSCAGGMENAGKTLPGAPAGVFVIIQFQPDLANKASATETVTPMEDKDGTGKVSAYSIK